MRGKRLIFFTVVTVWLLWLMRTPSPPQPLQQVQEPIPENRELGQDHAPAECGSLICKVVWSGEVPQVKPLSLSQARLKPGGKLEFLNPNAPRVDKSGGLADAVVLLRGIDLKRSRPWDLPPVRIDLTDRDFQIHQGENRGRIGIVRRGREAEFVARDDWTHSARARGSAFFTQMLFVQDQPVSRLLSNAGTVELTSGSGYFWMRGYLVVSDHPYVGVSDESGDVRFDRVPVGTYEVVCWKANWHIARIERDPEWLSQASLDYLLPIEKKQSVRIQAGTETRATFAIQSSEFASR